MEIIDRLVFLDTETTGLDPKTGHRIIEVAAVEAVGRRVTGNSVHFYVDPEREIDEAATAVHGFTWSDLRGKAKFSEHADELMRFCKDARIIIHNAAFDIGFLDAELARCKRPKFTAPAHGLSVLDSLALAREQFPGKRNSLDALCDRLGIDNSHRELHGALLDTRLLAEVYFAMTRSQSTLEMGASDLSDAMTASDNEHVGAVPIAAVEVSDADLAAHEAWLGKIKSAKTGRAIWNS